MIQGDEPVLIPKMINQVVNVFKKNKKVNISNTYTLMNNIKQIKDLNRVKVVFDKNDNAIYFSREPISNEKINDKKTYYKQGNVFCFKKKSLNYFVKLKPSKLEIVESVDMNRLVEDRYKIKMVKTKFETVNVDNRRDYLMAKKSMKKDKYLKFYK